MRRALLTASRAAVAAATYVGAGAQTTTAPSSTAVPAGVQSGDVLFAIIGATVGTDTPGTPPSGWTQIATLAGGISGRTMWLWARTAGGTEPATYNLVGSGSNGTSLRAVIAAYRGVSLAAVVTATGTSSASTLPWPSVNAAASNTLLHFAFGSHGGVTGVTPAPGATERLDTATDAATQVFFIADTPVGAGATGVRTGSIVGAETPFILASAALGA